MTERVGVEDDYCPKCRGVWLDRGELDKLIERSASEPAGGSARQGYDDEHDDHDRNDRQYDGRGNRKRSFWRELFD